MRHQQFLAALLGSIVFTSADTTINPEQSSAYGSNVGWLSARGDVIHGAVLGEYVCSGNIWGANVGWIHLGSGAPANGIRYQNNSNSDFGVNHDGSGNLRGYAYGANIGWVNFESQGQPRIDLKTGRLNGHAWSANTGWISLSNAVAQVKTDILQPGVDTDEDGIVDAWELSYTNTLAALSAFGDADGDRVSDLDEHAADTSPVESDDQLRITNYQVGFPGGSESNTLTWSSRPTRAYIIRSATALDPAPLWNAVTPLIGPEPGTGISRVLPFPSSSPQRFFQVQAQKPLAP